MALEKIKSTTFFQRMRNLLLGTEKPNVLTRVSVISGFVVWVYLFSWQVLTFVSILLLNNLDQSPIIRAAYVHIGYKDHGYTDTINRLFLHSAIQLIIYFVILFSLMLIWRRKKIGFLVYVISNLSTLLITFLIMGWSYMTKEITYVDYFLIFASTIYFSIGILIFYKKKNIEEQVSLND